MIMLANCIGEIADLIQTQEKMDKRPLILGFRFIEGPWDNTYFLDVDTKEKTYSGMILKNKDNLLDMIAPFKIVKKDTKK